MPGVGSGSSLGSVARQRAGCCSWGLSQESAHTLLPHRAKFPPALQIWPPGTRAALCDHQAKRKWSSPQLAENSFAVGVNMAVRMISEMKLCSSVPRICSQDGKYLFRATVLQNLKKLIGFDCLKNLAFLLSRYLNYLAEYENFLKLAVHFQVASQLYFPHLPIFIPFG